MQVLITNISLRSRTGTEVYLRDLAAALLELGHTPLVYSPRLGELADELRVAGIAVTDDLRTISIAPDIIHGQHSVEAMAAATRFPGVPAVWVGHDAAAWHDTPPVHPRILRYVAVDDAVRDRLRFQHGIPDVSIRVLQNAVDFDRFKPRTPLPPRPARALVFSNYAEEESQLRALRAACRQAGILLDVAGANSGQLSRKPENLLGNYDLVFAKARCALEAMAVGVAVILCDAGGLGPMVTTAELPRLRRQNFGRRTLRDSLAPELVLQEIRRYNPDDAAAVSQRIRETAGLDAATEDLVKLYEEAIAEAAGRTWDPEAESRAVSAHLQWVSTLLWEREEMARRLERIAREDKKSRLFRALARVRRLQRTFWTDSD
jgi:glycosyltransferase involved in cell wall biosynthesis